MASSNAAPLTLAQCADLVRAHQQEQKVEAETWEQVLAWYNGLFTGDGGADQDSDPMHLNLGFVIVDSVSAALAMHKPRFSGKPVAADKHDLANAAQLAMDRDAKASDLEAVSRRSCRRALAFPRSFAKVVWNPEMKAPRVYDLDPRRVWWDFEVPFEESEYVIEVISIKRKDLERLTKRFTDPATGKRREGRLNADGILKSPQEKGRPQWLLGHKDRLGDKTSSLWDWLVIYEIHFPREGKMVMFMLGAEKFLYEGPGPSKLVPNPYTMLTFHDNLRDYRGMSDCSLVKSTQAKINELDELAFQHAVVSIPGTLVDGDMVTEVEVGKLEETAAGAIKRIKLGNTKGKTLRDAVMPEPTPTLSPDFYALRRTLMDSAMLVLGLPDWLRGQVTKNLETATQAALTEQGVKSRFTMRENQVKKFMTDIGERMLLLRQEHMDAKDFVDIGGLAPEGLPDRVTVRELSALVDIEVVAHDPMDFTPEVRLRNLQNLVAQYGASGMLDLERALRRIFKLANEDGSLVIPAQQAAAANAAVDAGAGPTPPAADAAA